MIEIIYDPGKLQLKLKGHAGAGVPGQDLICCACSMNVYTLAANVRSMQRKGWMEYARLRLTPGDASISCVPKQDAQEQVRSRFEAIMLGFSMLAREYPEFVRFTVQA